jgi:hypothetical protein
MSGGLDHIIKSNPVALPFKIRAGYWMVDYYQAANKFIPCFYSIAVKEISLLQDVGD